MTEKNMLKELPVWWPNQPPIYNIEKSYLDNLEKGPFFEGPFPKRIMPPKNQWINFLGYPVAVPLGVPAGPLLNANWVIFAAQMGFDIVTYKTIRSKEHPAHPVPNMVYVDTHGQLTEPRFNEILRIAKNPPKTLSDLAATNSFGIPSRDRDYLLQDIAKANAAMKPGQVMIVSVVGSPRAGEDFYEDFAICAKIAADAGAKIIEADFSCPNVSSCEGSVYSNPEAVGEICRRMKKAIQSIPLIIKVGVILDEEVLKKVMFAAMHAGADAICGINTVSMKVVDDSGKPALGQNRLNSGVCGGPIRQTALEFIRLAYKVKRENKLPMKVMATGGAVTFDHFDLFFDAGADVAMSAVGMMWDPYLAARYHQKGEALWKKRWQ